MPSHRFDQKSTAVPAWLTEEGGWISLSLHTPNCLLNDLIMMVTCIKAKN